MKRYCLIDGCDNELRPRAKSDICPCCQAGLRYWDDRDAADVMERQRKLGIYQARMGALRAKRRRVAAPVRHAKHAQAEARQ